MVSTVIDTLESPWTMYFPIQIRQCHQSNGTDALPIFPYRPTDFCSVPNEPSIEWDHDCTRLLAEFQQWNIERSLQFRVRLCPLLVGRTKRLWKLSFLMKFLTFHRRENSTSSFRNKLPKRFHRQTSTRTPYANTWQWNSYTSNGEPHEFSTLFCPHSLWETWRIRMFECGKIE